MAWYDTVGFQLSNLGLQQSIDEEIREQHPSWSDDKVEKERQKIQRKATLFNDKNKHQKKAKKEKKPKPAKKHTKENK